MERRRLDFDAARRERNAVPLEVVVGGQVYVLPPQLPASVALDIVEMKHIEEEASATPCAAHTSQQDECESCKVAARQATERAAVIGWERLMDLGAELFGGKAAIKELSRKHNLGIDELGELITHVFDEYNAEIPGRDPALPKPNRAQKRASGTAKRSSG